MTRESNEEAVRHVSTHRLGAQYWSIGYEWTLASSPSSIRAEAEREAALPAVKADVIAYRGDVAQFGLGYLNPRDKSRGMVAAIAFATQVAVQHIRNAFGIFSLAGGYWVVAIESDVILSSEGDRFIESDEEAFAAALSLVRKPGIEWDRVYLPIEWGALDDDGRHPDAALQEVLSKVGSVVSRSTMEHFLFSAKAPVHKQLRLRRHDINAAAASRPALSVYAVVCVCAAAYWGWSPIHHLFQPRKPAVESQVVASAPAPIVPQVDTPPPIAQHMTPVEFADMCFASMAAVYDHAPAGWVMTKLICTQSNTIAEFTRDFGKIDDVSKAYPEAAVEFDSKKYDASTVTIPSPHSMEPRPRTPGPTRLRGIELIRKAVFELAHSVDEPFVFQTEFAPPPDRTSQDQAKWMMSRWHLVSRMLPSRWALQLGRLPGVVITSITITPDLMFKKPEEFTWAIEGVAYAS